MRIIFLLYFLIVVIASCTPEGDNIYNTYNNYYPEDTLPPPDTTEPYSVQIHYPASGQEIALSFDWVEAPGSHYNCPWGYESDTTIYAKVTTNIPGTIATARVFRRVNNSNDYSQFWVEQYPVGDTLLLRIHGNTYSFTSEIAPSLNLSFWVSLTTEDSMNYASQTVSFETSSTVNFDMDAAPAPPLVDTLYEISGQQLMLAYWCKQSPNSDSCRITMREDVTGETVNHTVAGNSPSFYVSGYLPVASYSIWFKTLNSYGTSAASDTLHLLTREPISVANLSATSYSDGRVALSWSNRSFPDSILISRRDETSGWATIRAYNCPGNCPSSYVDIDAPGGMVYYYRIGLQYENGTWWSPDSVGAWIP